MIDAWYFCARQGRRETLQPRWFQPRSLWGLYAELEGRALPLRVTLRAMAQGRILAEQSWELLEPETKTKTLEAGFAPEQGVLSLCAAAPALDALPEELEVRVTSNGREERALVVCEYARLHGSVTDFDGKPYPAAVKFYRHGFGSELGMGVWTGTDGRYEAMVPKGTYNAFYVCDQGYRKSVLENWCWHMLVDRDERHDFKIGTGEVYSLCVWPNNGGFSTLFCYFRPMVLSALRQEKYTARINGRELKVVDIAPELELEHIRVTLGGRPLERISLQRIWETGHENAMRGYVLQTRRSPGGTMPLGKQTLLVEYDAPMPGNGRASSQGRTQFYFHDAFGLAMR